MQSERELDTTSRTTFSVSSNYSFPTQVGPQFANNDITHVSVTSIWRNNTEITQNTLFETQNSSKLGPLSLPGYLSIEPSDFQLLNKIGHGGFGEIYKVNLVALDDSEVYKRANGRKLVAKCMKTVGASMFQQEVSIMSTLMNRKYVMFLFNLVC